MIVDLNEDEVRAITYAEKILTIFDEGPGVVKSREGAAEATHCAVTLRYLNQKINKIKEERKKV